VHHALASGKFFRHSCSSAEWYNTAIDREHLAKSMHKVGRKQLLASTSELLRECTMTLLGESGAVVVNVLESFFFEICQPEGCLRTPHYMAHLDVAYYSTKGYGAL
jgi:hypothetical protein